MTSGSRRSSKELSGTAPASYNGSLLPAKSDLSLSDSVAPVAAQSENATTASGTDPRALSPSVSRASTLQGSAHTRFEIHPPSSSAAQPMTVSNEPPSSPPPVYDVPVTIEGDENLPPLFMDTDSSSQPLDGGYRPPEAVGDTDYVTSLNTWGGADTTISAGGGGAEWSTAGGGGASGWGTANSPTWGNIISLDPSQAWGEEEEQDVDDVDAFTPAISKWWSNYHKHLTGLRPGPGMLPPYVENDIGLSELYMVKITTLPPPSEPTSSSSSSSSTTPPPHFPPPTLEDVFATMPPHLFYDWNENGWRYIRVLRSDSSSGGSSALESLLTTTSDKSLPFPAKHIRARRQNCTTHGGKQKKTHHFRYYRSIVDSSRLDPPLRHLNTSFPTSEAERDLLASDSDRNGEHHAHETPEGYALDAYVCCLCETYVLVSPLIEGVVGGTARNRLSVRLQMNPAVGQSGTMSIANGWELILRVLEGWVFSGKAGPINVRGKAFQSRLGWNEEVETVFRQLGFTLTRGTAQEEGGDTTEAEEAQVLTIDPPAQDDPVARGAMLRAWIETSAYISALRVIHHASLGSSPTTRQLFTNVQPMHETLARAIGSHPEQLDLKREYLSRGLALTNAFKILGMTMETYSEYWLRFAYQQQIRCDPTGAPIYLRAFHLIAQSSPILDKDALLNFFFLEKSKGYWSADDLDAAVTLLGFGDEGALRIPFEPSDVDADFLMGAYSSAVQGVNARAQLAQRDVLLKELKEATEMAAQSTGDEDLVDKVEREMKKKNRDPREAYDALGATKEMDEDVLLAVFSLRVQDEPAQQVRWTEAFEVIAEERNSDRLRGFLRTGQDPGAGSSDTVVKPELPRGLHQLGNTCYLNSLLQYFYTIKDLRDYLAAGNFDVHSPVKEDELKTTLIGGRLITAHELYRSRRFCSLLNDLFVNLASAEGPAVLPEVELAKLALLTSKDEEEANPDREAAATSTGSADTDSTLVESQTGVRTERDGSSSPPPLLPVSPRPQPTIVETSPTSPRTSVLGKRSSEEREQEETQRIERRSPMEVDSAPAPSLPMMTLPPPVVELPTSSKLPSEDVEMQEASSSTVVRPVGPPPLPPRRKTEPVGEMMFGKQNDVSECMDNCIFQIECALQFDPTRTDVEKQNIVKQLFYGRSRQTISAPAATEEATKGGSSSSVKEDIFAQLLVNVSDEGLDLYDGLGHFLDDTVEFEGRQAEMEIDLLDLPPILQIQLQRVQFDREILQAKKNNAYVKFEETLRMDRFFDAANPEKRAKSRTIRNQLRHCRERIATLSLPNGVSYADSLSTTKTILTGDLAAFLPESDPALTSYLGDEQTFVSSELERARSEAKIHKEELEALWADSHDAEYQLCSVFIHRGTSPSWGHYFFYSRDLPGHPEQWYKYNDSEVTLVGKEEIFKDTTGSTANPYLLVYARKGTNVIDTVHRILPA